VTPTLITIRLRLLSPGGVTGPERRPQAAASDEPPNHLPLRRDPDGVIALPGSTVAGSLKAHCAAWPGLPSLFGGAPGALEKVPSPIQVLGVRLRGALPNVESATRVAIDRHRGAARVHALFTVEQLPAGTEFDVHLRWDNAGAVLDGFLDAVRAWRPRIGRGVTTGAGACAVTGVASRSYDLTSVDDLLAWLAVDAPATYPQPSTVLPAPAVPDAVVDVRLEIVDGLHIGSGVAGQLPGYESEISLLVQRAEMPYVPGSSLKGVLRSRVEYLCRVLGRPACDDAGCGACQACALFGWSARSGDLRMGARAAVAIPDAMIDDAVCEVRTHVALDRVTGGARDRLLYAQQVVVAGHFRLRVAPLRSLTEVELALLRACVADLHDGLIGLGAATTRGLGTVRIRDDTWVPPEVSALAGLITGGSDG